MLPGIEKQNTMKNLIKFQNVHESNFHMLILLMFLFFSLFIYMYTKYRSKVLSSNKEQKQMVHLNTFCSSKDIFKVIANRYDG